MNSYLGVLQHQVFFIFNCPQLWWSFPQVHSRSCVLHFVDHNRPDYNLHFHCYGNSIACSYNTPSLPNTWVAGKICLFFFFLRGQTKFITITRSIVGFHDRECSTVFLQTSIRANNLNSYIRIVLYSFDRFKLKSRWHTYKNLWPGQYPTHAYIHINRECHADEL